MAQPEFRMVNGMELLFPPGDWRPPPKKIGENDIMRYFALLFLDRQIGETIAIVAKTGTFDTQTETFGMQIERDMLPYVREQEDMAINLKRQKLYFYEHGGSLFMDFKYMVSLWTTHINLDSTVGFPSYYTIHTAKFHPSRTTQEAFETAQEIVATWWDIADQFVASRT